MIRYASQRFGMRRLVGVRLEGLRRGVGGMWLAMARYGTVRGLVGCRAPSEVGERPAVPVEMRSGLVRRALLPPYGCLPLFQAGIYSLLAVSAANRAGGSPRSGTPSRDVAPRPDRNLSRDGSQWLTMARCAGRRICDILRVGAVWFVSGRFAMVHLVPGARRAGRLLFRVLCRRAGVLPGHRFQAGRHRSPGSCQASGLKAM